MEHFKRVHATAVTCQLACWTPRQIYSLICWPSYSKCMINHQDASKYWRKLNHCRRTLFSFPDRSAHGSVPSEVLSKICSNKERIVQDPYPPASGNTAISRANPKQVDIGLAGPASSSWSTSVMPWSAAHFKNSLSTIAEQYGIRFPSFSPSKRHRYQLIPGNPKASQTLALRHAGRRWAHEVR